MFQTDHKLIAEAKQIIAELCKWEKKRENKSNTGIDCVDHNALSFQDGRHVVGRQDIAQLGILVRLETVESSCSLQLQVTDVEEVEIYSKPKICEDTASYTGNITLPFYRW